jgi:hypothetical protein
MESDDALQGSVWAAIIHENQLPSAPDRHETPYQFSMQMLKVCPFSISRDYNRHYRRVRRIGTSRNSQHRILCH